MTNDKLLTIEDLAAKLRLNKRTIQNQIYAKTLGIPFIRHGRSVRFKPSEVEKYLERRTVKPIA